ncbi:TIGR04255 family protein [Svornostia abyssi]|uniref:TIGR04255 family protein n=1 Tax=Svornostia abyssi TaxID=2898438 RepID=A0ABY5PLH9_9ACTN|nr:TIGR04255 family protein [Parviterribacteraceae bacterium J379]
MISDLPPPRYERLTSAPLELVVWQMQFAEPARVSAPAVGAQVAEALRADGQGSFNLSRLVPPQIAIGLGPGLPPQAPVEPDGWQLRRGQLVVNVGSGSVSAETTAYDTWEGFRATIAALCSVLGELDDVPGEQRMGLRYVDRVAVPGVQQASDWNGLLASWLTAPLAQPQLADAVLATAGQLELRVDEELQAAVRHRLFPDFERRGRQTVILDYDTFRQGYRPFNAEAALEAVDRCSDVAHRLFEASLTPDLYKMFMRDTESD